MKFHPVTICHGFITFFFESLLQLSPISIGIFAISQHTAYSLTIYPMSSTKLQHCHQEHR